MTLQADSFINREIQNTKLPALFLDEYFTKSYLNKLTFDINFVSRSAHIEDSKGKVIFHQDKVTAPDFWSQQAINILAQKYFRKTGVPSITKPYPEDGIPDWICRRIPIEFQGYEGENDIRQVVNRLVGHWTYIGWKKEYFNLSFDTKENEEQALIFSNELSYMLYKQIAAPNSPQWFNTGLYWAYGITSHVKHYINSSEGDAYEYPQIHACFINKVEDKLIGQDGIMDLWNKEARIFKYGSGSGCNYSNIRGKGEPLSGGGISSGLLSFLKIGDTVGGAIKSGGTCRRSARSVILNIDHPDVEEFIDWKVKEEQKVHALVNGSKVIREHHNTEIAANFPEYDYSFEGEAYSTVSGQNSNNSLLVCDLFMKILKGHEDNKFALRNRTDIDQITSVKAKELWTKIAKAAWVCGDPGLMFYNNINDWNTCINEEKIIATNPCFEYLWFTDTACNLASINLLPFNEGETFDVEGFKQACTLWQIVLDISVEMAGYPTAAIAQKSLKYRTTGLGFTNLGALLMQMGIPYDSERARNIARDICALMTGQAYITSAQLGERLGAFDVYEQNKESMNEVLQRHYSEMWNNDDNREYHIFHEVSNVWRDLLRDNSRAFRNAQVTVLAPTGTISFIMDCDTTGIEPDFALVKFKELSGGGNMTLVNNQVRIVLEDVLSYSQEMANTIISHVYKYGTIRECSLIDRRNYAIFDCANDISPMGHLKMVAACQPFISGGISKTINLPNSCTVEEIENIYFTAWEMGIKCISVYRDGCKNSQPLVAKKKTAPKETYRPSEVPRTVQDTGPILQLETDEPLQPSKMDVVYYKSCNHCGCNNLQMAGTCTYCTNCGQGSGCS
jgi:ribonucleoside-diphosphate reductase alpha chain